MNIITTIIKKKMTNKYYFNQPMSMRDRRITFIINENRNLINSLDRFKNHPLIGKYSHIPFNIDSQM